MSDHYIRDYKEKELRQFILAYLLITIASVALHTDFSVDNANRLDTLLKMAAIDVWVGEIGVLVIILNEIWPDSFKTKLIYGRLPSDTIFSEIAVGKDDLGFEVDAAKKRYKDLAELPPKKQSAKWNELLRASKEANCGNVIEAQRMQLMTRDICMSAISLLALTILTAVIFIIRSPDKQECWQMFIVPILYLTAMFFVARVAAKNRAKRLVNMVIKAGLATEPQEH